MAGETSIGEVVRSPIEQAIIDRAIDVVAQQSVADETEHMDRQGLRQAALTLAAGLDGTVAGFDKLAKFYMDHAEESKGRFGLDSQHSFTFAFEIITNYPVSSEVAEGFIAQCLDDRYRGYRADKVATDIVGRNLTDSEVLALATKTARDLSSSGSGDRSRHLDLARRHGASIETEYSINALFDEKDRIWANDPD